MANAHANCQAEVEVHIMKQIIRDNVTMTGKLDMVKFLRALIAVKEHQGQGHKHDTSRVSDAEKNTRGPP